MANREKMEDYFYFGVFLIAMLFALISTIKLYYSIDDLIIIWFDDRYRPIFQAFFSLSLLAVAVYFIKEKLIRR